MKNLLIALVVLYILLSLSTWIWVTAFHFFYKIGGMLFMAAVLYLVYLSLKQKFTGRNVE